MYTNVNLAAPVGVILFLGTVFTLVIIGGVFLYSILSKRYALMRVMLLTGGIVELGYVLVLLAFSLLSSQRVLVSGQEKHFCELDCHLAYSVTDVQRVDNLTVPGKNLKANGIFYVVTIKTRFDETTIGPRRGNALLYPNPRSITVVAEDGRRFFSSNEAQRILEENKSAGTPIDTPLRPSESYSTVYVFDVPRDVRSPSLLLNESDWVTHLIIGHENSVAHKKIYFQL